MSNIYYTSSGNIIHLDKEIGHGGEGLIYQIQGYPSDVAKIYINQQPTEIHRKILGMVQNPPNDPTVNGPTRHRSIAWPSDILYSDRQKMKFAGFIMPRVDTKTFKKILQYLVPEIRVGEFDGGFTWRHLYYTARNLASCISALHVCGYLIGDINESNILVHSSTILSIIDCDSFQFKDGSSGEIFRCKVGKGEYTAPEILGTRFADIDRTEASDSFALAVIIFRLLMEGIGPYQAVGPLVDNLSTPEDKIKLGIFPFATSRSGIAAMPDAPSFDIFPLEIQRLFLRCFDAGHKDPARRPTAKEWLSVLKHLDQNIKQCSLNINHQYFNHLQGCPWCERAKKAGKDSFPSLIGQQVPILDPNNQTVSKQQKETYLLSLIDMALTDGYLSVQEEEYLIDQGIKLHIPKKETKKLIKDEINKKGLLPGGHPILRVDKTYLEYKDVKNGGIIQETIEISNVGEGVLTGTISSNAQWIKIQTSIAPSVKNQSQKVQITIDTNRLTYGFSGTGAAVIKTNGGDAIISVSLATEGLSILLGKIRASYIPLSVSIFGLICSFIKGPNLWGLAYITAVPFGIWYKMQYISEQGIKKDLEIVKQIAFGILMGVGGLIVVAILKAIFQSLPHFSGFLIGVSVFGVASYLLSKKGLELSLNKGIDISKYPPAVIQGASVGLAVLAIIIHSGSKSEVYKPAPPISKVPAATALKITRSVIAEGLDSKNNPIGIKTIFSPGNKTLCYFLSYTGAVPNKTVFVTRLFAGMKQLKENQWTINYLSGNAWCFFSHYFEPGEYKVLLYVDGHEIQKNKLVIEEMKKSRPDSDVQTKPFRMKTWGFGPGGGKGVDIQLVLVDVGQDKIKIGFSVKSDDHKDILLYGKALQPDSSGYFYGESLYIMDDKGKKVFTTTGFVGGRQSKFNSSANRINFDPGEEIVIFAEFPMVSQDAKSFKFVSPMLHGHQGDWWWDNIPIKSFDIRKDKSAVIIPKRDSDSQREKKQVHGSLIEGVWKGNVRQGSKRYPITMTISQTLIEDSAGKTDYPTLKCGGTLTLKEVDNERFVMEERIEYGRNQCVDAGRIHLMAEDDRLFWEWRYPDGRVGGQAVLEKAP